MRAMVAWWSRRPRRVKVELVVLLALVALPTVFVACAISMPGNSHQGALPRLSAAGERLATQLRTDVTALVGEGGDRSQFSLSMERPTLLVETSLREAGYTVTRLPYQAQGATVANIEGSRTGSTRVAEIVVIGAHYDTAEGGPGADDNASGVAMLLSIAKTLAQQKFAPSRTLRFVAFANEEPPFFWGPDMGSLVYAKACAARGDKVVAMLSLESVGYYRETPGSQKYPGVVRWFFPDRGNFIAFVGNFASRKLVRRAIGTFRTSAPFPSEGAALPGFVSGVGWSDHWSFWQVDYPAIMVTDTAVFRNPHYHKRTDTPATLDYAGLARVTEGVIAVVKNLAE